MEATPLSFRPFEATAFSSLWDFLDQISQRHEGCRNAAE
jgi:hypothetical protein